MADYTKINVLRSYIEGASVLDISNKYDIPISKVLDIIDSKNKGQTTDKRTVEYRKNEKEALELFVSGVGIGDIANQLGIKAITVYKYLRDNNVLVKNRTLFESELTEHEITQICRMHSIGITLNQITEQFHINRRTAEEILTKNGVEIHVVGRLELSESEKKTMSELYDAKVPIAKIARQLGYNTTSITRELIAIGKHKQKHRLVNAETVEKILAEVHNKRSISEISDITGVSTSVIKILAYENGIGFDIRRSILDNDTEEVLLYRYLFEDISMTRLVDEHNVSRYSTKRLFHEYLSKELYDKLNKFKTKEQVALETEKKFEAASLPIGDLLYLYLFNNNSMK